VPSVPTTEKKIKTISISGLGNSTEELNTKEEGNYRMSLLSRIRSGTTTEQDAKAVENIMSAKATLSLRVIVYRAIMILFLLGGIALGLSLGGLFF
jgi:thiol:disulfide interchange protein